MPPVVCPHFTNIHVMTKLFVFCVDPINVPKMYSFESSNQQVSIATGANVIWPKDESVYAIHTFLFISHYCLSVTKSNYEIILMHIVGIHDILVDDLGEGQNGFKQGQRAESHAIS